VVHCLALTHCKQIAALVGFAVAATRCGGSPGGDEPGSLQDAGGGSISDGALPAPDSGRDAGDPAAPDGVAGANRFSFVVFGDLNGGACGRNGRISRLVSRMAQEKDVAFYLSTGDIIDGWTESAGGTACFASNPAETCPGGEPAGNMAAIFSPIKNRAPVPGLASSFFLALGNHDDNWGSDWYPDPCGQGICDFLAPLAVDAFIDHPHGDLCSLDPSKSAMGADFYYSFSYRGSTFIVLRQNDDYEGMLACNGSHGDCAAYCSDPALFGDATRNEDCFDVAQFDWLRRVLDGAVAAARRVIVFGHSPLLSSGDNHGANSAAGPLRALLEAHGVAIYINGHNHAYERTHPVRGAQRDPAGTVYLTVGVAGAPTDDAVGDWFTAATYRNWTTYGNLDGNAGYLRITVDGGQISGEMYSLGVGLGAVDTFQIAR
jgi:hypothetical protein